MHESFEIVECNLCGAKKSTVVYPSTLPQDMSLEITKRFAPADHVSGNDQIVRCDACSFVYASPRMKQKYIWQGYSDAVDEKYATQGELRMITFRRTLKQIEEYLPSKGKILDVGCAAGFFLKVAKDGGWQAQGIEPNKGLASFGSKTYDIPITTEDFLKSSFKDGTFDAVTFWDVLEHVTDPAAYIKECFRILKPGGYVFVNFPDFGSILAKLSGKRWWFLSPVHIYYFDKKTLSKFFEKEGFRTKAMKMHWQTLELGYLFKRFGDYSQLISKVGGGLCRLFRVQHFPIRYYASQTLAIFKKP